MCCSEARALRLGCWKHVILCITDLFQHAMSAGGELEGFNRNGVASTGDRATHAGSLWSVLSDLLVASCPGKEERD